VYVCVCVCMCACVHVYMYACVCVQGVCRCACVCLGEGGSAREFRQIADHSDLPFAMPVPHLRRVRYSNSSMLTSGKVCISSPSVSSGCASTKPSTMSKSMDAGCPASSILQRHRGEGRGASERPTAAGEGAQGSPRRKNGAGNPHEVGRMAVRND